MRVFHLLIIFGFCFYGCNKAEKMKEKLFPERPYEAAKIDNFYWGTAGHDNLKIPLIKPFFLYSDSHNLEWSLDLKEIKSKPKYIVLDSLKRDYLNFTSFQNIRQFNVENYYIYGVQYEYEIFESKVPRLFFVINTQEKKLTFFDKENDFITELKKLNLSEELLSPDAVFEQYKNDPVLSWFPEDIKKQLEGVKKQKGN